MSTIQQGLLISAIGMGLVFVVIIFLWGLMALMMRLTSTKSEPEAGGASDPLLETEVSVVPELQTAENQRRAASAAVAVLMAMASHRRRTAQNSQAESAPGMNPWQSYHRERQLENRNIRG